MTTATLRILTPEIILIVAAVAIYLGGAFFTAPSARRTWSWIAGVAMALAAAFLAMQPASVVADGSFSLDALAWFGRWMALGFGGLLVLLASRPLESDDTPEYVGSMLLTIAGLMLVAGANELILLFVGLELISIPTYVLLYLGCRDARCQEATVKYFFLSILSSAILLYGFSSLYGAAGSTELSSIRAVLSSATAMSAGFAPFVKLAFVLIFAGLCFKIAAVPFHFYAPDVYQGTTYPNATLLSVVPKAAGLLVMVRLLVMSMPSVGPQAWQVVLVISILTMTLGNVLALWQDNLRRLLAYSSIANAGYLLIGLAAALATGNASGPWNGVAALGFYLTAYAAATIGAFAVLEHLGRADRCLDGVEELAGLGRTRPLASALLALFMFSLTGVPPLAGFWGKLLIFGSAINVGGPWFIALAIVGALNAAVAAAYYLRIVAVMYFRTPLATPQAQGGRGAWWAAIVCALVVVVIGNVVDPALLMTGASSRVRETHHYPWHMVRFTHPTKKTATPVCPAAWSGGTPSGVRKSTGDAIIAEVGDNIMSYLREKALPPRKTPM
jgi:NADH-quinone oxidoreductase subunit N